MLINRKVTKKYSWLNANVAAVLIIKALILVFAAQSYQAVTDQPINETNWFLGTTLFILDSSIIISDAICSGLVGILSVLSFAGSDEVYKETWKRNSGISSLGWNSLIVE